MTIRDPQEKPNPGLYSFDPDIFARADEQMWAWEERETGIMPRVPQIINSGIQEEEGNAKI